MYQNRVDPEGNFIKTAARGAWMGNRGQLHDAQDHPVRKFKLKAWLTCLLQFRGRKRKVMSPDFYTELFFLDEATAFAAGHRPCFECRRKDYDTFKSFWIKGNPGYDFDMKTSIQKIDEILHNERINAAGEKVTYQDDVEKLPDGTFILIDAHPYLTVNKLLYKWSPFGYEKKIDLLSKGKVVVLTPKSTVNAFRAGYKPQMAL